MSGRSVDHVWRVMNPTICGVGEWVQRDVRMESLRTVVEGDLAKLLLAGHCDEVATAPMWYFKPRNSRHDLR